MMIEGSGSIPLTSGSGSGRPKNMWIRIRNTGLYLPRQVLSDPDPLEEVRIRILLRVSSSKNDKKNLDSYCFVTSLKNDKNVGNKVF
jgi:hypothetical protein